MSDSVTVFETPQNFYRILAVADELSDVSSEQPGKGIAEGIKTNSIKALISNGLIAEKRPIKKGRGTHISIMINGRVYECNDIPAKDMGRSNFLDMEKTPAQDGNSDGRHLSSFFEDDPEEKSEIAKSNPKQIQQTQEKKSPPSNKVSEKPIQAKANTSAATAKVNVKQDEATYTEKPAKDKETLANANTNAVKQDEPAAKVTRNLSIPMSDMSFDEFELVIAKDEYTDDVFHFIVVPLNPAQAKADKDYANIMVISEYNGKITYQSSKNDAYVNMKIGGHKFQVSCSFEDGTMYSDVALIDEADTDFEMGTLDIYHAKKPGADGHIVERKNGKVVHIFPVPKHIITDYELPEAIVCIESNKGRKVFCAFDPDRPIDIMTGEKQHIYFTGKYSDNGKTFNYTISESAN